MALASCSARLARAIRASSASSAAALVRCGSSSATSLRRGLSELGLDDGIDLGPRSSAAGRVSSRSSVFDLGVAAVGVEGRSSAS